MKPLYSTEQIINFDRFAIEQMRIPSVVLMENAVESIFQIIKGRYDLSAKKSFALIAGKGNNGGDGFALARKLIIAGHNVSVFHLYEPSIFSKDAKINFDILFNIKNYYNGLKIIEITGKENVARFKQFDFIIDAILGSGSTGNLSYEIASIVKTLNRVKAIKISVDIPTGLNSETGYGELIFSADMTVSLGGLKRGLFFGSGYTHSGIIEEGSIGIDPTVIVKTSDSFLIEGSDFIKSYPRKKKDIHKYTSGKSLIVAGSGKYIGAALLTSHASMKTGAGAVVLAFPDSLKGCVVPKLRELVVLSYKSKTNEFLTTDNLPELNGKIAWSDSIIIGPGLGREPETLEAIKLFLQKSNKKKTVIDADALYAISLFGIENFNLKNAILTPHIAEFSLLIKKTVEETQKNIIGYGKAFAQKSGSTLILKGPRTIIFTPDGKSFISPVGNSGLAKFGTGDVLSGIIGGILAQGASNYNAAISGVYLHGKTGDYLRNKYTEYGFTASQIIDYLPSTLKIIGENIAQVFREE